MMTGRHLIILVPGVQYNRALSQEQRLTVQFEIEMHSKILNV